MRVIVVSTHRSDKAHYAPLLRLLASDERFDVAMYPVDPLWNADVGIVLGDRFEMLLAATCLVEARIPLLHIHGGEHTYGSLDERYRYAMTALADWHCVVDEHAKHEVERYLITGEWGAGPRKGFTDTYRRTANNVVVTGAPGLDGITDRQPFPNAPRIVVLYNPAIDAETTRSEVGAIGEALSEMPDVWWLKPNGDRFADLIPYTHEELDAERFRDLLAAAQVIVGNSSAGIIEAPSLGTWTVNVGERQAGRPRAASVIDVGTDPYVINSAVRVCTSTAIAAVTNPYGDGHASERIRDVLLTMGVGSSTA